MSIEINNISFLLLKLFSLLKKNLNSDPQLIMYQKVICTVMFIDTTAQFQCNNWFINYYNSKVTFEW